MEAIEQELEQKSVERVDVEITEAEPEQETPKPVKKVKKPRSAAQIAAFEKARKVRAEKIKQKKEQKVVDKVEKKALKKKVKETVEEAIKRDNDLSHGEYSEPQLVRQPSRVIESVVQPPAPPHQREQVVNNYYYYGPPQHAQPYYSEEQEIKPRKSRRKKRPPTPSESSDEEDYDPREPLEYAEGEGPYIPPNPPAEDPPTNYQPTYKFSYA